MDKREQDEQEDGRCRICDDEIVDSGTEEEEAAAAKGLCARCYEDEQEQ